MGLPLLVAATMVHAETLYVIETLVVNLNSAPDSTGERVANIKSGDAVEVIERQNDQVHVRLANGTEGWVKKSYLATEEPVIKRLNERTAEVAGLKQDVARLEAEVAAAKAAGSRAGANARTAPTAAAATTGPNPHGAQTAANSRTTTSPGQTSEPTPVPGRAAPDGARTTTTGATNTDAAGETNTPADPGAHEPPYFMTPPDAPAHPRWHWALGSFVVALGLGFLLGWRTLDGRIRRKYGGLRIY
jgi:hypothetical protein